MPEHTFHSEEQQRAFDADMERRTNIAKVQPISADEHYKNFLSRIQTREAFQAEIKGKLHAVLRSGYPLEIRPNQIDELVAILPMDTLGSPQFWPPKKV